MNEKEKHIHETINFPAEMKKTKQREEIFRILTEASEPMSAVDIYNQLLKVMQGTNFAISTVYRALTAFEEKGYVTKSSLLGEDMSYYEWNQGQHKHYAVCIKCHKLIPLRSCPFEHARIEPQEDFTITRHKLELYGYCKECR